MVFVRFIFKSCLPALSREDPDAWASIRCHQLELCFNFLFSVSLLGAVFLGAKNNVEQTTKWNFCFSGFFFLSPSLFFSATPTFLSLLSLSSPPPLFFPRSLALAHFP